MSPSSTLNVYRCRYCGKPAPDEWGTGCRCPEHPRKGEFPAYMQECEFCPVPGVERDKAIAVIKELTEALVFLRDANYSPTVEDATRHSHNWFVENAQDETGSTILGYIPEAE